MADNDKIDELVSSGVSSEELAESWERYVRDEVNSLLDIFLPEAVNGNVGVIYNRPVKKVDAATGQQIFDEDKAKAVDIHIVFEFPEPIVFFENKPSE
jgi:hypothetical protein